MPLYMDRHDLGDAVTAEALAMAHVQDLAVEKKHDVKFMTYWFDDAKKTAFCLVYAPDQESVTTVHREAHGEIPSAIIPVDEGVVQEFLGKIGETAASEGRFSASNPPSETALRTVLFTDMERSTEFTQRVGDAVAMELLRTHNGLIRDALSKFGGREVKHTGDGIMASFVSASGALESAIAIQGACAVHNDENPDLPLRLRIGASTGEPVLEDDDLFGATVQLAARICARAEGSQILISNVLRELCIGKGFLFADGGETVLRGFEEPVRLFEVRWEDRT